MLSVFLKPIPEPQAAIYENPSAYELQCVWACVCLYVYMKTRVLADWNFMNKGQIYSSQCLIYVPLAYSVIE